MALLKRVNHRKKWFHIWPERKEINVTKDLGQEKSILIAILPPEKMSAVSLKERGKCLGDE